MEKVYAPVLIQWNAYRIIRNVVIYKDIPAKPQLFFILLFLYCNIRGFVGSRVPFSLNSTSPCRKKINSCIISLLHNMYWTINDAFYWRKSRPRFYASQSLCRTCFDQHQPKPDQPDHFNTSCTRVTKKWVLLSRKTVVTLASELLYLLVAVLLIFTSDCDYISRIFKCDMHMCAPRNIRGTGVLMTLTNWKSVSWTYRNT